MQGFINGQALNTGLIRTNENCRGCNKCLSSCPTFNANVALNEDGTNRILLDQQRCILCGRCISACTHMAREFVDDTDNFFSDLEAYEQGSRKKGISLIVAPSFIINYPTRYKKVLGYLKHLGVTHIYSVSFGADITIWGYLNYLQNTGEKGMIAQPCPPIVNYIETYRPALLPKLMPIQSPAMCAAIYLKKYMQIEDDIAFLGPCIAKKSEFERPQNKGLVSYSITFDHLMKRLEKEDISIYEAEDSELEYGMGAMFSMHGGMRENLEFYLGLDAESYINQKEGEDYSYSYLDLYANRVDYDDPYRGEIIDILNCARGCNYGTATEFKDSPSNHIPYATNRMRAQKSTGHFPKREKLLETPAERLNALNERFFELNLKDFFASYGSTPLQEKLPSSQTISATFKEMLKLSQAEQSMDCTSCGMHSCREMATAIALGRNYKENCVHYVKKKLFLEQSESLIQKQKYELLQASKNITDSANIDQLTGFLNRYGFEQQMAKSINAAHVTGAPGHVLMLDMDDFKTINESYGVNVGNTLLIEFSQFLKRNFGELNHIFRIGGDEFVLILDNSTSLDARSVADKILHRAQEAWNLLGVRFYCTVSVGIAIFPSMDESANDIMRNVELAMYAAKQNGKNNYVFYTAALQGNTQGSVEMIRAMRDDIANDFANFSLAFQPWVGEDGCILGCEGLMRWKNQGENISPGVFIPLAEETGLINPLGDFALREAAKACKEINSFFPDFITSVNVSTKQLEKKDVMERFMDILHVSGVQNSNMVLEVTESLHLENTSMNKALVDLFVQNHLQIALDDFGTGYSSLSSLSEFPFDLIKLDRSFIQNIEFDEYYAHLLSMITDLMHKMGRRICVEGVEEEAQLAFCRQNNVDIIQGFYYYKPMPFVELKSMLLEQRNSIADMA